MRPAALNNPALRLPPSLWWLMCAAALLVQGSAHVYSKKVEYLHQLVYQALDVIADRK